MEFRVLGPLEVRVRDRPLALGGSRPRVVLATLLLARNTVVPVERLIGAIWGDDPPGTPTAQIQAAVSALRKTLAAAGDTDRIVTRSPGYLIRIDRGELDLDEFDRDVAAARRALAEGDVTRAADGLRAAMEWWRDDALVDLAELPIRAATVPVDERRWTTWEERIEADLTLRRHGDLVPELSTLVTKKPLRDRLWTQLMRAQYRSGRRADALETYQRAREVMRDELGLEPAPELVAVHRAILSDDPTLDPDVLPLGSREWTRPACPYRALEAYQPGDAAFFFGRAPEIAAVVRRACAGPVTVVGPSGSGKSSLVLAGVLPALERCTALVVRPSDRGRLDLALAAAFTQALPQDAADDLPALAARILDGGLDEVVARVLAHTGAERLVVVLDQAEDVLTQDGPLVDRVVTALFAPAVADRLTVLATLRADFLGAVLQRPALSTTLGGRAVFTLGAMGPDQLREAVTAPIAGLPGVAFQAGLVDRILRDVGSEAGALALLGLTLTLLWDDQADGTLTHQAYDDLGRVPGALAAHAEGEWRRRNLADDEPALRRLVGRLVSVQAGSHVTRRVASRGELDEQAWRLAVRLSATRLLVVTGSRIANADDAQVELAHEALTTHWPRLRGWIEGDLDFHLWRTALQADLARWRGADRDPALLARGAVLAAARQWRAERGDELGPDETDYVRRSERQQRSAGHRSRAGLAAAVVLVLVLGTVFVHQRSRTAAASAEADSRALAARSVTAADRDPAGAALMAVAAYDRAPTDEARSALFARYRAMAGLDTLYAAPRVETGAVGTSADGRVVAATDDRSAVTVWVHDPGRPARTLHTAARSQQFDVTPDGSAVWVLAPDGIARFDVVSGATRTVVPVDWSGSPQMALSPDGQRILLRDVPRPGPVVRVRQWATLDGRELPGATLADAGTSVWPGPDPGTVLVQTRMSGAYRLETLDLATGARSPVTTGAAGALATDYSGVVTCTVAEKAYVLTGVRIADRAPLGRVTVPGDEGICPNYVVGPRGRVVVDLGLGDVRLVDLPAGQVASLGTAAGGWGSFLAAVTPDGSRLLTTGSTWVGTADLSRPENATPLLRQAAVLDDGRALAGVSDDGARLVVSPLVPGGPTASAPRPSPYVDTDAAALEIGHSGLLADRVADRELALHRLPGLDPLATVTLPPGQLRTMFFDGADRLVTVVDRQVLWWDTRTGALAHRLDLGAGGAPATDARLTVAATPDPNLIAVTEGALPDVTLRDTGDGHVVETLPVGRDVAAVSFQESSDEMLVSRRTSTEVWDRRSGRRIVGPLPAGAGVERVAGMSRAPGRFLVLDSDAGRWHLRTYQVGVAEPLSSLDLGSGGVPGSFSADGSVITLDRPNGALSGVLRLDPAAWRTAVCSALAGAEIDTVLPADDRAALSDGPVCADPGATPR